MLLVTGPTGSGKSTTLYSCVQMIRRPAINIVTVEDPIEYTLPGLNQVQVNTKAGLTFASSLRSVLRQDPDVVMVGEIRDIETAEIPSKPLRLATSSSPLSTPTTASPLSPASWTSAFPVFKSVAPSPASSRKDSCAVYAPATTPPRPHRNTSTPLWLPA